MSRLRKAYVAVGSMASPAVITLLRVGEYIHNRGRARVIVQNGDGEVLLVGGIISTHRHALPGGGIERGESARMAAVRELAEETGIVVAEDTLEQLCYFDKLNDGVPYNATIFYIKIEVTNNRVIDFNRHELHSAEWIKLSELPKDLGLITKKALAVLSSRG